MFEFFYQKEYAYDLPDISLIHDFIKKNPVFWLEKGIYFPNNPENSQGVGWVKIVGKHGDQLKKFFRSGLSSKLPDVYKEKSIETNQMSIMIFLKLL